MRWLKTGLYGEKLFECIKLANVSCSRLFSSEKCDHYFLNILVPIDKVYTTTFPNGKYFSALQAQLLLTSEVKAVKTVIGAPDVVKETFGLMETTIHCTSVELML